MSSRLYKFGEFVLSVDRRELLKQQGTELVSKARLTDLKFKLLLYLIENRDKIITKEDLLDRFWTRDKKIPEDSNLTTIIGYLRADLEDEKILDENGRKYHRFINTIHGVGYRFTAEVKEEENLDDFFQDKTTQSVIPFNLPKKTEDSVNSKEDLLYPQSLEQTKVQSALPQNTFENRKSELPESAEPDEKLNLQSNENATERGENNVFSSSKLESEVAHLAENLTNSNDNIISGLDEAKLSENESLLLKLITKEIYPKSIIIALIIGILAIVVHLLATVFANDGKVSIQNSGGYALQAGMCFLFAAIVIPLVITSIEKKVTFENSVIRDSFHQFLIGWLLIWSVWFWLYFYIYVMLRLVNNGWQILNSAAQTTVDFLNACTSAAFFYTFLVMDTKSVTTNTEPTRDREFRLSLYIIIGISILITFLAGVGRISQNDLTVYLSGLFAAVSMFYFFGRLDSHHMDVNRWFLAPLYSYASIQVIGPKLVDFGEDAVAKGESQGSFFYLLLALKVYLFVMVLIWLSNGSLKDYFTEAFKYIERKSFK